MSFLNRYDFWGSIQVDPSFKEIFTESYRPHARLDLKRRWNILIDGHRKFLGSPYLVIPIHSLQDSAMNCVCLK